MFRPAAQTFLRASARAPSFTAPRVSRRFASSSTVAPSSWRSFAIRLGLAGGAVYYYNTSPIFAEEPPYAHFAPQDPTTTESLPTLDSITAQKRERLAASRSVEATVASEQLPASPEALQEEADSQGAFNPETGEINWDCPCLGGMAYGPCGEEFKAAFSCFVYSNEEPKGMDCIEKFKGMQDCFRRYPEIYGAELEGDEDDEAPDGSSPVPEAFENPSVDPTKPLPTELVPIAPEVHEEHEQPQKATVGISETQLAREHLENKHPIDNEIKNENTKAATKRIMVEHAALDDDGLPKSLGEKRDAYMEKK